eukprot:Clim_evm1s65 gene=Clim_evmTU1s65
MAPVFRTATYDPQDSTDAESVIASWYEELGQTRKSKKRGVRISSRKPTEEMLAVSRGAHLVNKGSRHHMSASRESLTSYGSDESVLSSCLSTGGSSRKGLNVRFSKARKEDTTYAANEYDRSFSQKSLTQDEAVQISVELEYFKTYEMQVHEASKGNTHYFKLQ